MYIDQDSDGRHQLARRVRRSRKKNEIEYLADNDYDC